MGIPLRALIIEDSEDDALLLVRMLQKVGYDPVYERVETADAMGESLERETWDVILSDYSLPHFSGSAALTLYKEKGLDIPFIIVSGTIGEEAAVTAMVSGAHDYVMKKNLPRLIPAIQRELKETELKKERKKAEEALRISEKRYRMAQTLCHVGNWEYNLQTTQFWGSDEAKRIYGFDPARNNFSIDEVENCIFEKERVHQALLDLIEAGKAYDLEFEILPRNSSKPRLIASIAELQRDGEGNPLMVVGVIQDITEPKRVEGELKQSEANYRSIFENVQEGVFRSTLDGRITLCNQALAIMFGYESPEEMRTSVTDLAGQHYVNPDERRKLQGIIEEDGFIKGYELQNYRKDRSIIWVSITIKGVRDEKGQIIYYDGIIENITNRKQTVERITKALEATVQAIALTVETKDPYTAGHQRRVAALVRAISTEMNLPIDMIEGASMAAVIHDLGKISVPAEILSKPAKLTNFEFALVKTHSQSGYDILKDLDFPWPVARMVLEHHERMNGSGYPNGLTGDNILKESRILSVADVVESMASHRPYRPSLGIEAALEEIEKNRGTLYDNAVVDVCLRLFLEKGYQF